MKNVCCCASTSGKKNYGRLPVNYLVVTGRRWTVLDSHLVKKAISMGGGGEPFISLFGQTEIVPLINAKIQA